MHTAMSRWRCLVLVVPVVAVACARPSPRLDDAQRSPAHIFVQRVSNRSPTLIVVNGGPGVSHEYLRPEWDRIAAFAGLVYYDQRGCGRSERRPPYTWQAHVQDLDGVIRRVAGGNRVVLAGSSWGTWLVLLYTLQHPERVRGGVLTGIPGWPDSMAYEYMRRDLPTRVRAHVDSLDAGFHVAELALDSSSVALHGRGIDSAIVVRLGPSCPNAQWESSLSLRTAPPVERLRQIEVPVLFIAGGRPRTSRYDREDASQTLARIIPHATVFTIANGGHDPWYDAPDVFFRRVQAFVQTLR